MFVRGETCTECGFPVGEGKHECATRLDTGEVLRSTSQVIMPTGEIYMDGKSFPVKHVELTIDNASAIRAGKMGEALARRLYKDFGKP